MTSTAIAEATIIRVVATMAWASIVLRADGFGLSRPELIIGSVVVALITVITPFLIAGPTVAVLETGPLPG
jgi:hypothetical protein